MNGRLRSLVLSLVVLDCHSNSGCRVSHAQCHIAMMRLQTRIREYFGAEYQPGEAKLVRKIDFFILTFCCLSYFTNYVSAWCWEPTSG